MLVCEQLPYQFKDYMKFFEDIRESDLHKHHLMCELYMHGFILETEQKFNIGPFLRDIQLREFVSYMLNQMKWDLAFTTFEANQAACPLRIMEKHFHVNTIIRDHNKFIGKHDHARLVQATKEWCIITCAWKILTYKNQALEAC